jgi:hypothetical protein
LFYPAPLDDPSGGGYFYAMSIKKKIVSPHEIANWPTDLQQNVSLVEVDEKAIRVKGLAPTKVRNK